MTVNGASTSGKWADNIESMAGKDQAPSRLDWYGLSGEREDCGRARFVDASQAMVIAEPHGRVVR
ncbi:hypothetical protein [Arthrobacter sp. D2-10]